MQVVWTRSMHSLPFQFYSDPPTAISKPHSSSRISVGNELYKDPVNGSMNSVTRQRLPIKTCIKRHKQTLTSRIATLRQHTPPEFDLYGSQTLSTRQSPSSCRDVSHKQSIKSSWRKGQRMSSGFSFLKRKLNLKHHSSTKLLETTLVNHYQLKATHGANQHSQEYAHINCSPILLAIRYVTYTMQKPNSEKPCNI